MNALQFVVLSFIPSFLRTHIYNFILSCLERTSFHMVDPVADFHLTVNHTPGLKQPSLPQYMYVVHSKDSL